jgi:hypothetical protein
MSSPVVAWWRIPTLSSASVLTFITVAAVPQLNHCSNCRLSTNSQAGGHLTPTSYSSHCHLKTLSVTLRLTVSQSVSLGVKPHLGLMTRYLLFFDYYGLLFWGDLSDERTGLSFVYAAGPRQRSISRVRVPWDSWPCFTVTDLRLPFSNLPPHGWDSLWW